MSRIIITLAIFVSSSALSFAQLNIIPQPVSVTQSSGSLDIRQLDFVSYQHDQLEFGAAFISGLFKELTGRSLMTARKKSNKKSITLIIDTVTASRSEEYILDISPQGIEVTGHDVSGVLHGIQSLHQLLVARDTLDFLLPYCKIVDYPRFAYRGMHLDVGRHMFSVDFIKKYIDYLSFYKLNTFHWHLTEDQGWRIEIKKYPKLQSVAAFRDETLIGHKKEKPHVFDGVRYGGFYTQEEVREVVRYASERQITVIPEIEMPGHSIAALTAYPQLGCTGGPYEVKKIWGIEDHIFCAGNEEVFSFLEDVIDEVIQLFPGKYIHIGGDEAPKKQWSHCSRCQKRIRDENLKDEYELQSYFVHRMERYINSKGKDIIGWDEILEGGLSKTATVMSWTGESGAIAAAKQKNTAIMSLESVLYFDHYQSLHPDEPITAGGYTPLKEVYEYEPVSEAFTQEEASYLIGIQGQMWAEYARDKSDVERMVFPRLMALSEIAWTKGKEKNYPLFLEKVRQHEVMLAREGVNYFKYIDEITYKLKQEDAAVSIKLETTLPQSEIRFTTDGTRPVAGSAVAENPIRLMDLQHGVLRAQIFKNSMPIGREFKQEFIIHKALGKLIQLKSPGKGYYNPEAWTLVNGMEGSNRYHDGQWIGLRDNLEAVIDLGAEQSISFVGANVLNYSWQKMWPPKALKFFVSKDGQQYTEVYNHQDFPYNGVNKVRQKIKPVQGRYVKVVGEYQGTVPKGEYGEGTAAWLMVDEIIIN